MAARNADAMQHLLTPEVKGFVEDVIIASAQKRLVSKKPFIAQNRTVAIKGQFIAVLEGKYTAIIKYLKSKPALEIVGDKGFGIYLRIQVPHGHKNFKVGGASTAGASLGMFLYNLGKKVSGETYRLEILSGNPRQNEHAAHIAWAESTVNAGEVASCIEEMFKKLGTFESPGDRIMQAKGAHVK